MKLITMLTLITMTTFTTTTQASTLGEYCSGVKDMAYEVMRARQLEIPRQTLLATVPIVDGRPNRIIINVISGAYNIKLFETDSAKEWIANDYADHVYYKCVVGEI